MAGTCCFPTAPQLSFLSLKKLNGPRCCSQTPKYNPTPSLLKIAVSGLTEILRLFSSTPTRVDVVSDVETVKVSVSCIDDILDVLKSDFEREYFVTGSFTSEVYVDDCIFEDPTIKFRGKALYSRNLNLLVPFFEQPSIMLQQIKKGNDYDQDFVVASWKLRTYLKLPWKPLICIDGSTVYDLNNDYLESGQSRRLHTMVTENPLAAHLYIYINIWIILWSRFFKKTLVKGANLMQSLSTESIRYLKEVVLPSESM